MQKNIQKLVGEVQDNFQRISQCQDLDKKLKLIQDTYRTLKELENWIQGMESNYKKARFQKQLEKAKEQIKELAKKTEEQKRMRKNIQDITLTFAYNQTVIGEQILEKAPKVMYNPRLTFDQNVLRNIVVMDAAQSNVVLNKQEIEELANNMGNDKEVVDDILGLVNYKQQKERANSAISEGSKISQTSQTSQTGTGKTKRIVLNLNNCKALNEARNKLKLGFGSKIKSFFKSLFRIDK